MLHIPPSILAKLSGIKNFDLSCPMLGAQVSTTGISMATIGVLFMNALAIATEVAGEAGAVRLGFSQDFLHGDRHDTRRVDGLGHDEESANGQHPFVGESLPRLALGDDTLAEGVLPGP